MQLDTSEHVPFWRNEKVLSVLSQILVFGVVAFIIYILYHNMQRSLTTLGLPLSLDFLKLNSSFDIGESLIEYSRASTYLRAYFVGVLNTLLVASLGIVFTTILGILVGVARLSSNWLVSKVANWYIEILRNIPLLVLLIFWYTGVFLQLPNVKEAARFGNVLLSSRGVAIPWGIPTASFVAYRWILLIGLVIAVVVAYVLTQKGKKTGRMPLVSVWSLLAFIGVALIGWFILPQAPWLMENPALPEKGFNIIGGKILSPEFMALLSGLVIYTSAFIAEVVRAGIQSVSKGQVEAAHALGLTSFQTLRLVVFPQALRVIIPPLTSQFLNLTKNSSLAIAVGYPDTVHVYGTIVNQSGRAVEMTGLVMATYLTFSLLTAAFMNWYNKKIKLVER